MISVDGLTKDYRGLRAVSPATATITMFSVPIFGTISSVIFLGESFTSLQTSGALITITGALLAVLQTSAGRRRTNRSGRSVQGAAAGSGMALILGGWRWPSRRAWRC